MSDIPYSVRDKNVRVNAIKGFNFADINTNEMFKKVDDNNVGGTDIISTQTSNSNRLAMKVGGLELSGIGVHTDGTNGGALKFGTKVVDGSLTEKLRINNIGAVGIGGATYGDAGAVLTSNGPTLPVSWVKPILFTVKKITDTGTANPIVGWQTPEINVGGGTWVDGTYTVQSAGYYDINFQAEFRAPAPSSTGIFISINVDGGRVSEANNFFLNTAAGDEYLNMTVSKLIFLSIGKLVTVQCGQQTGTNLNNSHFKIIRVAI